MKAYFLLQIKLICRRFRDMGLPPMLAIFLVMVGFLGLSMYLFYKTDLAQYVYLFTSLSLVINLSDTKRNDFLRVCFDSKIYLAIRIIENVLLSFPFIIFLIFKHCYLAGLVLLIIPVLLGMFHQSTHLNITIPSPFRRRPFEFTIGFRNTFYVFFIAYGLTIIAASVGNFNLGVFSLMLIFLLSMGFYSQAENEYYVWIFSMSPKQFLLEKLKTAIWYVSISSLPILLTLSYYFPTHLLVLVAFFLIGCLFLITMILAKYSSYPNEINVLQGFIIALCVSFPPFLLFFTPYFYIKATKQLQYYLL